LKQSQPNIATLRDSVDDMKRESLRVSEVLDSIRSLCRNPSQERQPIDVNALVITSLELLGTELKDYGIRVSTELAPAPPPIAGHKGQLQEVLVNIFRNAIDAMQGVTDRERTLWVKTEQRDRQIAISVEDSGCGIEPRRIASLFDAFVTTKAGGMGLGLGICRMIVDRHNGQLSASSQMDKGTQFTITLPVGSSARASSTRHFPVTAEV
jgi:signal transduction histidine kinase